MKYFDLLKCKFSDKVFFDREKVHNYRLYVYHLFTPLNELSNRNQ